MLNLEFLSESTATYYDPDALQDSVQSLLRQATENGKLGEYNVNADSGMAIEVDKPGTSSEFKVS